LATLITGGAGFAGSHLAEYLLAQNEEVIALVRPADEDLTGLAAISSGLRVERADLLDGDRLLQVLRDFKPERLYHLAAMSSPSESFRDPRHAYDVNFGGTLNLLLALRRLELDCRFLYVSTAEVYGPLKSEDLPLREDTPLRPASPYAGSKAAAEFLAIQFFQSYGLPIVRVRPFNHTGPRQSSSYVCSSFARQVAEIDAGQRDPLIDVGNLKVSRDFSDVRDIVRGYFLLLEKGIPGEVYHLGMGHAISIETILHILMNISSKSIQVRVDETKVRSGESPVIWGDISKALRAVGWRPQYTMEMTLGDLRLYWENKLRASSAQNPLSPSAKA
jgi:GDP-4-dehydro-6-deoxy-D-mannose reductase